MEQIYTLRFDGASKGNPGEAGSGAVLFLEERIIAEGYRYIGSRSTNNQAEYNGLILGLEIANELNIKTLIIEGDSKLAISQILGQWKVNNEILKELNERVKILLKNFNIISISHIYRHFNKEADLLANKAVDNKMDEIIIYE